jgi:defect-in-organelle-trafficking protein DotB
VSDVKIQTNNYIYAKWHGQVTRITRRILNPLEVESILQALYGNNGPALLKNGTPIDAGLDFSPARGERYRFRMNAVGGTRLGQKSIELTIRPIPVTPPSVEDLGLEDRLVEAAFPLDGLVLFIGKTGSGKSTAISALMRKMFEDPDSNRFVAMFEDPIEFIYDTIDMPSTVLFQSEVGGAGDLKTFLAGVENAMRRAPDAIYFGETRKLEGIEAVSAAAESGHAVYTTLHAKSIVDMFSRVSNWYPAEGRDWQMNNLISLIRLVVWQRLFVLPPELGPGRFAVREYLPFTDDVRNELLEIGATNVQQMLLHLKQVVETKGVSARASAQEHLEAGRMTEKDFRLFTQGLI